MAEPLPVWRGHRGDGPVANMVAGAATDAELEAAKKGAHDRLVDQLGSFRAGPVCWYLFGPSQDTSLQDGVRLCVAMGVELEEGLRRFLSREPASTLVLAMAPTDRISRRTPPRSRKRSRR